MEKLIYRNSFVGYCAVSQSGYLFKPIPSHISTYLTSNNKCVAYDSWLKEWYFYTQEFRTKINPYVEGLDKQCYKVLENNDINVIIEGNITLII
jgi:hypothetical protein